MAAIWNFRIFAKNAKTQICTKTQKISLTVGDRAISLKFLTQRVFKQCSIGNFQRIFLSPKMASILNFRLKCNNTKLLLYPKPCKTERFRQNFQLTGCLSNLLLPIFKKISSPQKWRPF